jgi:phosphatidylglycerol:prolipoprotein diacylglycerol transferase
MGGCCFGKICNLPWAVKYPFEPDPFDPGKMHPILPLEQMAKQAGLVNPDLTQLRVHPSPIYESLISLLICIVIYVAIHKKVRMGTATALWLTLYPLARFLLEFLRGDVVRGFLYESDIISLSTSQFLSLLIFAGAAVLWRWVIKQPHRELVTASALTAASSPSPPARETKEKKKTGTKPPAGKDTK